MSDAKSLIEFQEALAQRRTNFDNWWQQIAYRVMPSAATFTTSFDTEGTRRNERLFSGRAVTANERFAAIMDDLLTPRTQRWHVLTAEDENAQDDQEVGAYLERVNDLLFSLRYRPGANFASQKAEGYLSVGAFGNSCMYVDDDMGKGPRYRHVFLKEVFWSENHQGQIDVVHRRYKMQARQAVQCAAKYGWELPQKIITAATKSPLEEFEFLHCVQPNEEIKTGQMGPKGMPWSSYHVCLEGQKMLGGMGGYKTFPYAIGRYMLSPRETYARSPAMAAWGAILTINEEKKTILRAGQKEVDPPLLLTEDGCLEPFNLRPGALNHGALSDSGEPLVQPLKVGANIPLGMELMALEGQEIDDSFLVTMLKILTDHPQMTATQVLEIAQQRAVLLAPIMGRQHSEDLGPLIAREFQIAADMTENAWITDEMPDALREAGGAYKIEYRSPLARAMRAQDGIAIMRTFESMPAAIQLDPNAAMVIDVPESLRELAEINGMPSKLIRDPKVVAALLAQKQEQEQQAAAVASAPEMSQAALNAAKAEQLRGSV